MRDARLFLDMINRFSDALLLVLCFFVFERETLTHENTSTQLKKLELNEFDSEIKKEFADFNLRMMKMKRAVLDDDLGSNESLSDDSSLRTRHDHDFEAFSEDSSTGISLVLFATLIVHFWQRCGFFFFWVCPIGQLTIES